LEGKKVTEMRADEQKKQKRSSAILEGKQFLPPGAGNPSYATACNT